MHPRPTPPYSCNKRKGGKKTEEMKSHLYPSGNNHAVWVRQRVHAVLPEYHGVTLLKSQTNTKSSKKEKQKDKQSKYVQPL